MAHYLLVDAAPLLYSNYSTVGHLATSTGVLTGVRYGFLRGVRSYANRMKADKVVITWDSPGLIVKAEGMEEYKSNREWTSDKEKMYAQVPDLKKMLSLTCWTQVIAPGFESDDIIGFLTRKLVVQKQEVTIVTVDNDMLQLVGYPNVKVFTPGGKGTIKDDEYVRATYGVSAVQLLAFRACAGDKSDNVQGFLSESKHPMLREWLKGTTTVESACAAVLEQLKDTVEENVFKNNLRVMHLHDPGESLCIQKGFRDKAGLEAIFNELEFKSMIKYLDELTGVK